MVPIEGVKDDYIGEELTRTYLQILLIVVREFKRDLGEGCEIIHAILSVKSTSFSKRTFDRAR